MFRSRTPLPTFQFYKMFNQYLTYTLTVFISLFAILATAHSQQPSVTSSADRVKEVVGLKLTSIAIGLENDLKKLEILDAMGQSVGQIGLRKFAFSREFTCPVVEGKLIFGVPNGFDEEGKPLYKVVASKNWQQSNKQACLIFIPKSLVGNRAGSNEYLIQTLDMSQKFQLGHTKVINFTPFETMVRLGEYKKTIKPWSQSDVSEIKQLTGVKMAQISVLYNYNGELKNVRQSRFRYLEDTRYITFIYPDIKNKRVAVNVVKDFGNLF